MKFLGNGLSYSPFVHRKSFPSGHSSFSFAVFTFSFLYLAGKARSFTGGNGGRKIPSVLFLLYLGLILGWSTVRGPVFDSVDDSSDSNKPLSTLFLFSKLDELSSKYSG